MVLQHNAPKMTTPKSNLLRSGAFDYLKDDAKARGSFPGDLTGTAMLVTPVQEIRNMLSAAAKRVDLLVNSYLTQSTEKQLMEAVCQHQHIKFSNPYSPRKHAQLTLTRIAHSKQKKAWCLYFGALAVPVVDLDIQEVLGLLQTLENVLHEDKAENTFKG